MMQFVSRWLWIGMLCVLIAPQQVTAQETPPVTITRIATDLQNPRGVAVLPDGRLLVAQTGTGFRSGDAADNTGKLSLLEDLNSDGDIEDDGEITHILDQLPGYNILYQFNPGRDEVIGIGDVLLVDDGRVFFTLDDNFDAISVQELSPDFETTGILISRPGSMNSIAYDPQTAEIYIAESTLNSLSAVTLDGDMRVITSFDVLAHGQQAVPSGVAIDPNTGDVFVALFSGQLWDYYGTILSFMPGDSKIVRVDPVTGRTTDVIVGLTTAVDVATDEAGNLYVVELTTEWATPPLEHAFDVHDPSSPPDPGGYARFTGRVTLYPVDGGESVVLADGLDQPTNITYHDGALYVSVGQGTPGRSVWGRDGITTIVGEIYKIQLRG